MAQDSTPKEEAKRRDLEKPADSEIAEDSSLEQADDEVITTDSTKWEEHAKVAKEANKEKFGRLKEIFRGYWKRKKWTLPVTVLVLLLIILGVPFTRYKILGLLLKHDVTISVIDSVTDKPVSGAIVTDGGKSAVTNATGQAKLHLSVGPQKLTISKKYYKAADTKMTVNLFGSQAPDTVKMVATGRQVPITVTNKITGKGIAGVHISVLSTDTQTDKDGKATLVLPTTTPTQKASITLTGYNTLSASVQVTDQVVTANNFAITPSGKLYFLSNLSGSLDVVKTNLDGSDRQTILAGTGKEDPNNTALLATRDWKYLALLSSRDGSPGIYLINTSNDSVTNIDGGSNTASFTLIGWNNHTFVYQTNRSNIQSWQSGAQVLKSYDADAGKLYNLDQTTASGSDQSTWIGETIGSAYIINNQVVYSMNWSAGMNDWSQIPSKQATLNSVGTDGSGKRIVKSFSLDAGTQASDINIQVHPSETNELNIYFPSGTQDNFYDYENGDITTDTKLTNQTFYSTAYDTYLLSPAGKQTFWSEVRDNKNTLLLGDVNGNNGKQVAALSEYTPYGWYTDNYLLVSKNGSELYIMPVAGTDNKPALKITDYFKPQLNFNGYGGGYGGL